MKQKVFRHDLERSEWLYHLFSLLNEGFSLSEALTLLMEFQNGKKREWCKAIYDSLLEGEDFSSQLLSGGYSKDIVSYLFFVEKYGNLQKGLDNVATILKKRYELALNMRKLLQYPIFLIVCLLVIIAILSEGVFPQFQSFYETMNHELPWFTRAVITVISFLKIQFILFFLLGLLFLLLWFKRKPAHERISILLKIPYIRSFVKSMVSYYLSSQLSPMLINGFSLYHALKVLEEHSKMEFFHQEARALSLQLEEGDLLSDVISNKTHYDSQLSAVIRIGEAKGKVGMELERFANFLFNQQYERIQHIISILQPLSYGVIGFIVLVLFLSMMLPIFNIVDGW